jgi:hypothetical protein
VSMKARKIISCNKTVMNHSEGHANYYEQRLCKAGTETFGNSALEAVRCANAIA